MRKYSKAQNFYLLAKAHLETLEAQEEELDRQYIINSGITNPDGSTPERIYCIEDVETFDRANEALAKTLEESGLWAEILEARQLLKKAEQNLIDWGLGRVKKNLPAGVFETLQRGMKQDKVRQKLIDLTIKLVV
jgi:aspartate/methionine/tyrosine aminotransferase